MGLAHFPPCGSREISNQPFKCELIRLALAVATIPCLTELELLITPLKCSRYVALKFVTADLTGKNNEIKIYQHLASQSPSTHPGSGHVPTLLDHFRVHGVNGEHDVLVLQVLGPDLETMFDEIEPSVVEQSIKSLTHQVALGASFLHHCGVVHGGWSTSLSSYDGRKLINAS